MTKRIEWSQPLGRAFTGRVNGSHLFTVRYSLGPSHTFVLTTTLPVTIKNDLGEVDVLKDRAERILEQAMARWGFVPKEDLERSELDRLMDREPGS